MTPSNFEVRLASLDDEQVVYEMICGLENSMLDREAFNLVFRKNLNDEMVAYFIAEQDHKPIGMGSCHIQRLLHHAALVAEIQEMFVYEHFRSMDVGKALMSQLVKFAEGRGAIQLEVTSRAYRESAHRFYQREGFEKSHVKLVRYF